MVWAVLPTHLDYEAAYPALEEYAEETDGVEVVFVRLTRVKAGADLAAETRRDIAGLQDEEERDRAAVGPLCESGWTGDRCTLPLLHDGPHNNEGFDEGEATR